MYTKTTTELLHEIKAATDIEDYLKDNRLNMIASTLSRHLNQLLAHKNLSRAEVVRGSLLDRAYVYQIFSGEKTPSRDKMTIMDANELLFGHGFAALGTPLE